MNANCKPVVIGTVGAGFAAGLHGDGYARVCTVPVRLKSVVDPNLENAQRLKNKYGYEQIAADFQELLQDPEIDVIDILTPPFLHKSMILSALQSGKHVICEKPLTGYFGEKNAQNVGHISKRQMYDRVLCDLEEIQLAAQQSEKLVMYAENYVYAPPIQKAAQLLQAKKSKILFMKGEESTRGSMTAGASWWSAVGGGPLLRIGCHPLTGMLYLKQVEAQARGESVTIDSVLADTGVATQKLSRDEMNHLAVRPGDVEDFGTLTLTFSDGTKCMMIATDIVLGGTKNYIEIYGNDSALICNLTPTDMLNTYFLDEKGIENIQLSEMLPGKLGWNKAFVSDEVIRGYMDELSDFMEAVAFQRQPLSSLELAIQVTKVLHAAYCSAEEEKRIYLA